MRARPQVSLDILVASFARLTRVEHLAQLILSRNTSTAYVDNISFHK